MPISVKENKVNRKHVFNYSSLQRKKTSVFVVAQESSLREAEAEAPKKGKGFVESLRDWVRPATDKAHGMLTSIKSAYSDACGR